MQVAFLYNPIWYLLVDEYIRPNTSAKYILTRNRFHSIENNRSEKERIVDSIPYVFLAIDRPKVVVQDIEFILLYNMTFVLTHFPFLDVVVFIEFERVRKPCWWNCAFEVFCMVPYDIVVR